MRIFISHALPDADFARRLREALVEADHEVWNDESVEPGGNIALAVGQALERAEAMIVLLSKASASAFWVQHEIDYAITHRRFEGRLLPVYLEPDVEGPWILRRMRGIAVKEPTEAVQAIVEHFAEPVA